MILQQAWSLRLRDRINNQVYGPAVNLNNSNRGKNNEPCRRFNRGRCNFGTGCRYEHRCSYCFKFGHGSVNCRKAIADRSGGGHNNNQNNQNRGAAHHEHRPYFDNNKPVGEGKSNVGQQVENGAKKN